MHIRVITRSDNTAGRNRIAMRNAGKLRMYENRVSHAELRVEMDQTLKC